MNRPRCVISSLAAVAAFALTTLHGAEVAFTGGTDGAGTDLATAANWSGEALPGVDDVGVVDFSSYKGGNALTLSADLALGGLRLSNMSADVSITGESTLTLGAEGVVAGSGKRLTLGVPVATAAKQVWDLCQGRLTTSKTFSGTSELVISNYMEVVHNGTALGYDGNMRYYAAGNRLATVYKGTGKWCKELWGTKVRLQFGSGKKMYWKDIFTSRTAHLLAWPTRLELSSAVGGEMNFEDGDKLDILNDRVDESVLYGTVNQYGGDVVPGALVWLTSSNGSYYNLMGGSFKIRQYWMFLSTSSTTSNVAFVQSGGTGYVNGSIDIGGNGGNAKSIADCVIKGGEMTSTDVTLCSTRTSECSAASDTDPGVGSCAGVYTQTGGSLFLNSLAIGNTQNTWDAKYRAIKDGFGLFRLMGGTVKTRVQDGGISIRRSWNDQGTETGDGAGRYRLSFSGGTFIDQYDRDVVAQLDFPKGDEGPFTYDLGSHSHRLLAPIWGEGTLRKVGSGVMRLNDATRFTGTLQVDEGAVGFSGGTLKPYDFASDGAIVWNADDAASGKDEGTEVLTWSDLTGTYTASDVQTQDSYFTNITLKPKVVLNSFNGHAGVKFYASGNNVTGLMAPKSLNPLNGCTNFTFAVVFKTTSAGPIESTSNYMNAYNMGILGSHVHYGQNNFGVSLDRYGRASFCRSGGGLGNATAFTTAVTDNKVNDGKVQVLVGSSEGCTLNQTLNQLGLETSKSNSLATSGLPYRLGYVSTTSSDTVNEPLCFGFVARHVTKWDGSGNPQPRCAFQGEIAEVRLYPERMMTERERNTLATALKLKYDATATADTVTRNMSGGVAINDDTPVFVEKARVALPSGAEEWNAADVVAEDGASVSAWTSRTGKEATQALGKGEDSPTYVKRAIAGRPAIRFDEATKTALGIAAADSPLSSATAFTLAVVFKTRTDGVSNGSVRRGRGLLSTVQGTTVADDVLLALQSEGSVYAANGNGTGSVIFNRKPCRLNDGCPHVTVYSADMANKVLMLMTDGRKTLLKSTKLVETLPSRDLLIGRVGNGTDSEHFDGEIAAFAVWPRALTADEMTAVTEHYAHEFRFRPLAKGAFAAGDVTDRGLGATNIVVASGARFCVPFSEKYPFDVGAGVSLAGEGRFVGSYSFGAGSTLSASVGVNMEQAVVSGGTIEVDYDDALANGPKDLTCVTRTSGQVVVRVVNLPERPKARVPLFRVTPGAIGAETKLVLAGEGSDPLLQRLLVSDDGLVTLFTQRGNLIILK